MSLATIINHVKSSCSPSISPIFRQTGVQMMQMMAFRFTLGIHESPGCVRSTSGTANSSGRRVQLGYPTKKRPRLVGFRLNEDKKNRCHKHIHPAQTNGLYFNLIQLNLDSDGVGTPNSHHPPRKAKNMASQCSRLSQEVIFGIKEASRGWEIVPCLLLNLPLLRKEYLTFWDNRLHLHVSIKPLPKR